MSSVLAALVLAGAVYGLWLWLLSGVLGWCGSWVGVLDLMLFATTGHCVSEPSVFIRINAKHWQPSKQNMIPLSKLMKRTTGNSKILL